MPAFFLKKLRAKSPSALPNGPVVKDPQVSLTGETLCSSAQFAGKSSSFTPGIDVSASFVCMLSGKMVGFQIQGGR
jgi:hypothetical protein